MSLNKITELVHSGHEHGIDMHLAEEGKDVQNDWGNVKMPNLSGLTGMTGRNEPLHIIL